MFADLGRIVSYGSLVAVFVSIVVTRRCGVRSRAAATSFGIVLFLVAVAIFSRLLATPLEQQSLFDVLSAFGAVSLFLLVGLVAYVRSAFAAVKPPGEQPVPLTARNI